MTAVLYPLRRLDMIERVYSRLDRWIYSVVIDMLLVMYMPLMVWICVGLAGLEWSSEYTIVRFNNYLTIFLGIVMSAFVFWVPLKLYSKRD